MPVGDKGYQMRRSKLNLREIVVIGALMLGSGAAFAAEDVNSANYLMPACRELLNPNSNVRAYDQGTCAGLITGLSYLDINSCKPSGVTRGQTYRVVVQYIDSRPARMHEDFRDLALEAMKAAWPCKR
jgi:hypothetical protein